MDLKWFTVLVSMALSSTFGFSEPTVTSGLCVGVKYNSFVADPEDCTKFYQCNQDSIIHGNCPTGMFFHSKDVCSLDETECGGNSPIFSTTTDGDDPVTNEGTSTTITLMTTTPSTDGAIDPESYCLSANSSVPMFIKSADNCSNYYICVDHEPVLQKCAAGKYWNSEHLYCDDPKEVPCEHDRIANPEEVCEQRPIKGISFTASPYSCAEYYICIKRKSFLMHCASGTHWNTETNQCDDTHIAKCKIASAPPDDYDKLCAQKNDAFLSHPKYCDLYLFCRNGKASIQRCPFLTDWDPTSERCLQRHQTKCTKLRLH